MKLKDIGTEIGEIEVDSAAIVKFIKQAFFATVIVTLLVVGGINLYLYLK